MIISKNLSEAEQTFFSRINTLLKYRIVSGSVKSMAEASVYVLREYFERLPEYGDWEEWEHREHVREIFTDKNIESAFQDVEFMDKLEKESFVFEMEADLN